MRKVYNVRCWWYDESIDGVTISFYKYFKNIKTAMDLINCIKSTPAERCYITVEFPRWFFGAFSQEEVLIKIKEDAMKKLRNGEIEGKLIAKLMEM